MNLNKVILIGRAAADPESRTTPSGQMVTNFRMATSRVWNDRKSGQKQEATEWHSVVAWAGLADVIQKYLKKGQLVEVEGRLQTRSWEGKDGQKRYRTEIVAENLQLGPKSAGGGSSPSQSQSTTTDDDATAQKADEDIPVINEDSPTVGVTDESPSSGVDESKVDLKDIPF